MIPQVKHTLGAEEAFAAKIALRSGHLTSGPIVREFERALEEYTGAANVIACHSGTAAIHLALCATVRGATDPIVGTGALTYISAVNAIGWVGAAPYWLDIDPKTLCTATKKPRGCPDLDALVVTHYGGATASMRTNGVIIEDAACAIGSRYQDGLMVGSRQDTLCCFSFHAGKMITTAGEGGAIAVHDPGTAGLLRMLRDQGVERAGWRQDAAISGFNYRMTEIQAAVGIEQLKKLDGFIARRRELALRYRELLSDMDVVLPEWDADLVNWCYFPIQVDDRDEVMDFLWSQEIRAGFNYKPAYQHSLKEALYCDPPPETEKAAARLICLPLYPTLSEIEQDYVCLKLKEAIENATS